MTRWVADRLPDFRADERAQALGVVRGGALVAGAVYDNWNGVNVHLSVAAVPGSGWATRRTLFALFYYAFRTLGCRCATVMVASTNLASLRLATGLGFRPEAILRYAAQDGSDAVVMKMFEAECGWIENGRR